MSWDLAGDAAQQRLDGVVPRIECGGWCQESCGPIAMTGREFGRLVRAVGRELPTRRMAGVDPALKVLQTTGDGVCPLLVDGRCSAHEARPMVCRLWGVVESMPCVYGCRPERVLSDREGRALAKGEMP